MSADIENFDIKELWPKMSMLLKYKWWAETDYGRLPPSEDLKQEIRLDITLRALGAPGKPDLR